MVYNEEQNENDILALSWIYKHVDFANHEDQRKLMRLIRKLERIADNNMEDRSVGGVKRFNARGRLMMRKYPPTDPRTLLPISQAERNQIADDNRAEIDGYIDPE